MYIPTFEILKNSIVDRIKDFYSIGWSEGGANHLNTKQRFLYAIRARSTRPSIGSLNKKQ